MPLVSGVGDTGVRDAERFLKPEAGEGSGLGLSSAELCSPLGI